MGANRYYFERLWMVSALEYRAGEEWRPECDFAPDEWSIEFLIDGGYVDIYSPAGDMVSGCWTFDAKTGVLEIEYDGG